MCIRDSILTEVASAETVIKAINEQKEQDEARFIINNKFNKIIRNQLNNVRSVSYTHLDVYKRQILESGEPIANPSSCLKNCLLCVK